MSAMRWTPLAYDPPPPGELVLVWSQSLHAWYKARYTPAGWRIEEPVRIRLDDMQLTHWTTVHAPA